MITSLSAEQITAIGTAIAAVASSIGLILVHLNRKQTEGLHQLLNSPLGDALRKSMDQSARIAIFTGEQADRLLAEAAAAAYRQHQDVMKRSSRPEADPNASGSPTPQAG